SFRVFNDPDDGCSDLLRELEAKPFSLGIIVADGLGELCFGWFKELNVHRGFLPTSSKTCLAGMALISPRSNASRRSSASFPHNASIPSCDGGFRLDSRCSAISARSAGGSDNAFFRTCVPLDDMPVTPFLPEF